MTYNAAQSEQLPSRMRLDLDSPVACSDGAFGELADVVIDPGTRCVTHLVVQEHGRHDSARLVRIDRVRASEASKDATISLDSTIADVTALKALERTAYVPLGERPVEDPDSDVGIESVFELPPNYSLGANALQAGIGPMDVDPHVTVTYDEIPKGTVEIRRESEVRSSDGHHVGHVVGLIVDEQDRIVELILEHGHLWGKREVAIPIASIDRIESDEVVLTTSLDEAVG